MFSDSHRWIKFGSVLTVLIVSGIYHNINLADIEACPENYHSVLVDSPDGSVCLSNVKIEIRDGRHLAVTRHNTVILLNLPEVIQQQYSGDFAIKGTLTHDNHLMVEKIRKKHSQILKIIASSITALIVCSLFFLSFRISRKGFIPRTSE